MAQKYSQIKKTQLLILLTHGLQEDFTCVGNDYQKLLVHIYYYTIILCNHFKSSIQTARETGRFLKTRVFGDGRFGSLYDE